MRLYTFSNFYLSSMAIGIQTAHVVSDLFIKYPNELHDHKSPDHVLYDWAKNHKTIICLNGGNNQNLAEIYHDLFEIGSLLDLPHCKFHEDEQSLGGIMTCCGIVVPEKIYELAAEVRSMGEDIFTSQLNAGLDHSEKVLISIINSYGLAK